MSSKKVNFKPPGEAPLHGLKKHVLFLKAIYHLQKTTKAPFGLVLSGLVSAAGDSCKDWVNVCVNSGQEIPLILYWIHLAVSGTGKSRVEQAATEAIREVESELEEIYAKQRQDYNRNLRVWEVKERAAVRALNKAIEKGEDTSECEEHLRRLQDEKPLPPRKMMLIVTDVTMAAIQQSYPTFSVRSDDAAHLLKKDFFTDPSMMCSIWSNQSINTVRGNKGEIKLQGARIGMSIMMQPKIFAKYYVKHKDSLISSGFLPRCLVYNATNAEIVNNQTDMTALNEDGMVWFKNRVKTYLKNGVNRRINGEAFKVLKLSEEALTVWNDMSTKIQDCLGPDGELECYREHSLRWMENAIRLAGVLEMFSDDPGEDISKESMEAGIVFVNWFFDHYVALTGDEHEHVPSLTDLLIAWLEKHLFDKGLVAIEKNHMRQCAPYKLRKIDIVLFDDVLRQLEAMGMVRLYKSGRTQMVEFIPSKFIYGYQGDIRKYFSGGPMSSPIYFAPNGKMYTKTYTPSKK